MRGVVKGKDGVGGPAWRGGVGCGVGVSGWGGVGGVGGVGGGGGGRLTWGWNWEHAGAHSTSGLQKSACKSAATAVAGHAREQSL